MRGREAAARLLLAVGIGASGAACGGGEQQFTFSVANDSPKTVVVQFESWLPNVAVRPGQQGLAVTAFGVAHGPIYVMDEDCRILHQLDISTQSGHLWIRPDGTPRLSDDDPARSPQLALTQACRVSTTQ